jgi:hypothetical protein
MGSKGRVQNLQLGGRKLRLKARLQTFSDEERIELESAVKEVIRNLDKTIRTETMYDVASNTVKRAREILQTSKDDSLAYTDVNSRSYGLQQSLNFTWTETDTVLIEPRSDIPYASITDMEGAVEITAQNAEFLRFYWFRYQFTRQTKTVYRPGNQYLSQAINEEASLAAINKIFNKNLDEQWRSRDNLTAEGGNLGSRKRRDHTTPAQRRRNDKKA